MKSSPLIRIEAHCMSSIGRPVCSLVCYDTLIPIQLDVMKMHVPSKLSLDLSCCTCVLTHAHMEKYWHRIHSWLAKLALNLR